MTIQDFYALISPSFPEITLASEPSHYLLSGLSASARAVFLQTLTGRLRAQNNPRTLLIVMKDEDEALYLFSDLQVLMKEVRVYYFPCARRRQKTDEAMVVERTKALSALVNNQPAIIVSYPQALEESVPPVQSLRTEQIRLRTDEQIAVSDLAALLDEMGMERVDFVFEPGQYAVRGGIVDIYSYSNEEPYRLDFFGDTIDSLRTFDIETQLSCERIDEITIVGRHTDGAEEVGIEAYLADRKDILWVSDDWTNMADSMLFALIRQSNTMEMRSQSTFPDVRQEIPFQTEPQPLFHKNFSLLIDDLRRKLTSGYKVFILADQKKQTDRLQAVLDNDFEENGGTPLIFTPVDHTLHAGWVDKIGKVACYTDHEIFERYHRVGMRHDNARRGKAMMTLRELNEMRPGDYVVHSDHGIGQFGGLVTTTVNGKRQEMLKIIYRDGDTLFVSIHNLHRLSKYKGKEGSAPTISKLGSGAWERLRERTKDKVKDIARDLIRLYAKRKQEKGFAYMPDGYMQHELEASFLYEDTPDQAKATADVKRDMESPMPMDRLICGDVGFGKTEVAMRAAFKAATDGKQTAVLVPTTVLALQHFNSFKERFKDFPVKVEYLSRGKSPKETKDILADLKAGKIDILIGTHKIVGKQVEWHDLGLLIIDEEQKLGVAVKDKLKTLRASVDVLTLTATPIPRTLQFSLLGARDMSIMTTPPPNRYPIQTEVIAIEDEDIIREAVTNELNRNGQVFVINNRIEMHERVVRQLQRLCPTARIVTAHGQMPPAEMEERLEAFINYDYDILVSTTIIESGVDIPNVNTMLIYAAQHYGLSDLHQLRGRVGRSNRKAYCYLIAPDRELLTADARRRLDAIVTFADLGSGFNLAMQDLDIRGAGNLLGAEQSGFIADLGYETYQRILNEAVAELKEEMLPEEKETETTEKENATQGPRLWCQDCLLESDLPLSFPNTYIENIAERLALYRELDGLKNEDELQAYCRRLRDRFGQIPDEAQELMQVVRLRWLCCRLGIEKVFLKQERMVIYFTTRSKSYYQSDTFGKVLHYIQSRQDRCRLVQDKDKQGHPTGKIYATVNHVRTVNGAITLLGKIEEGI
ncbi:MAG: transcription-repair coupling factor [Paludibacteraceae bacterium]|nr:transcription-repair coupling factor [Paludibacteraceae bacterium]